MYNPNQAKSSLASPYQEFRGPTNQSTDEYFQWAYEHFEPFVKKYDFLHSAYKRGELVLKAVNIDEPHGEEITFGCFISNDVIRKWYNNAMLEKPHIQRGTKTRSEVTLSTADKEYWQECFFDSLKNHHTDSYLFTFSEFWENAWCSNGAHRIILSTRFYGNSNDKDITKIDFHYTFDYLDLDDEGRIKTAELKGCESRQDIVKKIGINNWEDKETKTYHPVDLIWFKSKDKSKKEKKRVLKAHSKRFIEYNDNLDKMWKIHAIESDVNDLVRLSCNWEGFEKKKLDSALEKLWGYKKHRDHYEKDNKPYEWTLQTLQFFADGLDTRIGKNSLQSFVYDWSKPKVNKEIWDKYITFRAYVIEIYLKLNDKRPKIFKISYPYTRHFFALMMTLKKAGNQKQIANIIIEDEIIISDKYIAEIQVNFDKEKLREIFLYVPSGIECEKFLEIVLDKKSYGNN